MLMGTEAVPGSVLGPAANALVALGLFAVMLVVLRSRRPRRVARDKATAADAAKDHPVCGDPATGR